MRRRPTEEITQVIPLATMAEEITVSRTVSRSHERSAIEVLRDYLRAEGLVLARAADTTWGLEDESSALAGMVAALGA